MACSCKAQSACCVIVEKASLHAWRLFVCNVDRVGQDFNHGGDFVDKTSITVEILWEARSKKGNKHCSAVQVCFGKVNSSPTTDRLADIANSPSI